MIRHGTFALVILATVFLTNPVNGQTRYRQPPADILAILDAAPPPRAIESPTRDALLLVEMKPYPSIEVVAQPVLRLAGLRINPKAGCLQRTITHTGLSVQPLDGSPRRRIEIPEGASIQGPSWSHDGKRIAFARDIEDGVELWIADTTTGRAKPIVGVRLNDVLAGEIVWQSDNRHLFAVLVPEGRGQAPAGPRAPAGPNVQVTSGRHSQMATFQDLLASEHDEDLFQHFATGQLARIDTETGEIERVGPAALITAVSASPDEKYLLVGTVRRPFSYRVPFLYFTRKTEVWSATGHPVATVADLPISDDVPRQGVPTGPRRVRWQPLHDARLVWSEALDGGDPRTKVPHRDKVMALAAPFTGRAEELMKVQHRLAGFEWLPDRDHALITELDRDRRWRTTALVDLAHPVESRKVLFDLSVNDAYQDPGDPLTVSRPDGTRTILKDRDSIYLTGDGASPDGSRPFLDRLDLKTGQKARLFNCRELVFENALGFVGDSRSTILVRHQSKTEPVNYFTVDLTSGKRTKLTHFLDPAPQLTGLSKELIKYKRDDGVPLSGTLYLPPDYKEGTRLPLIVWAYPLEYSDPGTAGQVRTSPYMFTRMAGPSQLFFVTRGYAVLDNATMPVVGDPETMNDTYVEQISAAARAAIETLDKRGVIDPKRVGVGGHSYGAFMTANLLAHTDLFAAGIARSGAYNRSLTPFGFQSERRSYWEAVDLYTRMSPFTYAHKINEPILLIHGEADNNSGTFPIQSERLFQAINGNGGTARLVMLPFESHGYRARETVLHVLAEMVDWADQYVKNRSLSSGSPAASAARRPAR
ncbi:MAG TPA: prolyl oligopeptidase family serine peptidase [Isosphaeraceae bacterium]|nr:prolyl oligopeptidase family serine peptidase [Isosphaeraceae bacterium]